MHAVGEQQIEDAKPAQTLALGVQMPPQVFAPRRRIREGAPDLAEQEAGGVLAVRTAHRAIVRQGQCLPVRQLTVVGIAPLTAPQLARERVGIGQCHLADIGLTDMADDHLRLDRIVENHARDG